MLKKIVCLLVAVVMCCSVFTGCNLVSFNQEMDDQKVVITIESYDIASPDGSKTYTTKEHKIYKNQFKTIYDYYAYSYQQYYGMKPEEVVDLLVENLAVERIVLNLAEAYIDFGYITLDTYDKNVIAQNVYNYIDEAIHAQEDVILEERGVSAEHDHDHDEEEESETETTYPTKDEVVDVYAAMTRAELVEICQERGILTVPAAGDDAAQDAQDKITVRQLKDLLTKDDRKGVEKWQPSLSRYPGLNTYDETTRSLELEAFSRALAGIKEGVLSLYDITAEEKAAVEKEYVEFEKIRNEKGLSYVYGALADSTTAYLYIGKTYEEQQKMTLIEEYITGTVEVTRSDVEEIYQRTLENQKKSFAVEANYESAISSETPLLYFPDSNHFFVKHILVPFSAEQTTKLNGYKASAQNVIEGDYEDYRARLANEIFSYEHVDGEDYGELISIETIYNEVVAKVGGAATLYEKERAFDDLIYKYNTDPGIFGRTYGYMEKYDLGSSSETYMQEFADAARALYEGGVEGAISGKVVTDYGVHIMYLSKLPKAGEVIGLDEYYSYGKYDSVYSAMEESALTTKENAAFSKWREQQISRYYKGDANNASVVVTNEKEVNSVI